MVLIAHHQQFDHCLCVIEVETWRLKGELVFSLGVLEPFNDSICFVVDILESGSCVSIKLLEISCAM